MSALVIRLLGRPELARDGAVVAPPRGHKAWAVLAYLVLADGAVARTRLAGLIFGDADDPRGALRWTLAELRRALGVAEALRGDPVELGLPAGTSVDVLALASGDSDPDLARGDLLEGVEPGGADFDAWLRVERRRLASVCEGVLRDAALAKLAAGAPLDAAKLASRALERNQFDDGAHELLVRCLARAGEVRAARDHADACETLFRRELGRAPDPGVRRAASAPSAPPAGDRAAALGQLEAGRAAVDAGAVDAGIACLAQACAEARGVGDPALLARTLAALGSALVHSVRGGDEEGAAVLHEALALAEATHDRAVECKVCRELGFVAVQAGRGVSAGRWLSRAGSLAADDSERAATLGVRGKALSDRAHYPAAIGLLEESVAAAQRCGDVRQAAFSLALLGRASLLRGQLAEASTMLDDSLALVAEDGWVAFQPFPEALRADVALRLGDLDHASALLDHAFALGCRIGDPCWEAISARGRGRVRPRRCTRDTPGRRRAGGPRRRPVRLDERLLPGRARGRRDRRRRLRRRGHRCRARAARCPGRHAGAGRARRAAPRSARRPEWPRVRPPAGRGDRQPGAHTRGHTPRSWSRAMTPDEMTHAATLPQLDASSLVDGARLEDEVKDMYRHVAREQAAELHFEVGRELAERLGYSPGLLDAIPAEAVASFAGVGHHLDLAALRPGEAVLDLGSGSGTDVFCSAVLVGGSGRVVGVDFTDAQLEKAAALRDRLGFSQIELVESRIEALPFDDATFDAVISNGVINLSLHKGRVFAEAARVLRPGGRLAIADIVSGRPLKERTRRNVELWAACIAGAIPRSSYVEAIEAQGLELEVIRPNDYRFLSERALDACSIYDVESVSLLAVKRQ